MSPADIEAAKFNKFMVGARGDDVVVMRPPLRFPQVARTEALILAAHIVAIADGGEWEALLAAVRST